jgi:hypothetical protein
MIFTGATHRKVQEKEDYNFFLSASIDNTTGSAVFGFSGSGQKFDFNFVEGRVIDPSDNYTFSYDTGLFQISGEINQDNYNYYIDEERINFSGVKNNFKIDRFFVDCTGCNLNVENLIINGSGQTILTLQNMNQLLGDSGHFTGEVVVNDPAYGKFDIFSGEILTSDMTGLFSILTIYSTGIEATGILGISGLTNIQNQSPYSFEATLYTSFGEVVETFNLTGSTPFYEPTLTLNDLSVLLPTSGGAALQEQSRNYLASYILFTGSPIYGTGLPLNVSLSYYSGHTGVIEGALTGVYMEEHGSGYSSNSPPEIVISGGGGTGATVTGVVSPSGGLTGIRVLNGGSGYVSGDPTILIYSGVIGVQVVGGGAGYFSQPVFEFEGGREGGRTAVASSSSVAGAITSVGVTDFGSKYTGVPSLNLIPGLSGVTLTASGAGYSTTPTVFVENGGGSGAAVNALTGLGFITGFELASGGSGYTGIPTVSVSGGSPSITGSGDAVLASGFSGTISMYSGASASGIIGDYTKEFTGQFNLLTGSGQGLAQTGYYNFREAGQIPSDNLSYTGETIFFRENLELPLGVESEVDIIVTNLNYYDSLPLIAKLTVSGSGSQVENIFVTGIM